MALNNEKWVNITEATTILGISVSTIRRKIKNKDRNLKFKKQGGIYLIQVPDTTTQKITDKKEHPEETEQENPKLLSVLIKQLDEKDKLIKELNERIREAHILASGRLLENGNVEKEQEQDSGEIIYATGEVQQSENVPTQPTKDKKQLWKYPVYVLVLLATLGLIGLMLYQSGILLIK